MEKQKKKTEIFHNQSFYLEKQWLHLLIAMTK